MNREEQEYLEQYNIEKYDRPSIAVDMTIFTIANQGKCSSNYRKLPDKKLKILMVKRAMPPYKDMWALPGGFCKKGETVYEAAMRELKEETNADRAYLEIGDVFSQENRDPRGWIISQAFMALVDSDSVQIKAGGDAWEAEWFEVELKMTAQTRRQETDRIELECVFELNLQYEDVILSTVVKEKKLYKNYHESRTYEVLKTEGIAFDHGKMIICILNKLRDRVETDSKIVFDLMPEYFTLTDLQKAFETILNKKLVAANFRRKVSEYVVETDKAIAGGGHRPAKLFMRNIDAFYRNDNFLKE